MTTAPVRPRGQSEVSTAQALRDFLRFSPPAFHGEPDPIVAEEWLQQITRDLDTSEITDGRLRVSFAVRQLKGDAYHWWGRVQTRVGEDFEEFSELFLENYFPESARDARHMQFLKLQQGTMSVPEYEAPIHSAGEICARLGPVRGEPMQAVRDGTATGALPLSLDPYT